MFWPSMHPPNNQRFSLQFFGTTTGPTLRLKIFPGINFRAGNLKLGRKTKNELIKIDSGFLYITSKRLLFTGSGSNKTIYYKKIIDFKIHEGGIEVIKDSGKNQYFTLKNKPKMFAAQLIQHFIKNLENF